MQYVYICKLFFLVCVGLPHLCAHSMKSMRRRLEKSYGILHAHTHTNIFNEQNFNVWLLCCVDFVIFHSLSQVVYTNIIHWRPFFSSSVVAPNWIPLFHTVLFKKQHHWIWDLPFVSERILKKMKFIFNKYLSVMLNLMWVRDRNSES